MAMKLMIVGDGEHGKDTVADLICEFTGMRTIASSLFAAHRFIYTALKDKYGYRNVRHCWEDRRHHRAEWYNLIKAYNTPDPLKLMSQLYEQFDIYTGSRSREEFEAGRARQIFDLSIWVDRSEVLPYENKTSMDLNIDDADIVIRNNGTLKDLEIKVERLCVSLLSGRS